jgi:hypothetical protein
MKNLIIKALKRIIKALETKQEAVKEESIKTKAMDLSELDGMDQSHLGRDPFLGGFGVMVTEHHGDTFILEQLDED